MKSDSFHLGSSGGTAESLAYALYLREAELNFIIAAKTQGDDRAYYERSSWYYLLLAEMFKPDNGETK